MMGAKRGPIVTQAVSEGRVVGWLVAGQAGKRIEFSGGGSLRGAAKRCADADDLSAASGDCKRSTQPASAALFAGLPGEKRRRGPRGRWQCGTGGLTANRNDQFPMTNDAARHGSAWDPCRTASAPLGAAGSAKRGANRAGRRGEAPFIRGRVADLAKIDRLCGTQARHITKHQTLGSLAKRVVSRGAPWSPEGFRQSVRVELQPTPGRARGGRFRHLRNVSSGYDVWHIRKPSSPEPKRSQ